MRAVNEKVESFVDRSQSMCKLFLAPFCLAALLFATGFADEPKSSVAAESP